MARRRPLGCLRVAALAICVWVACKDQGDAAKAQSSAAELDRRCRQLAKVCGEKDNHIEKIAKECMQAVEKQVKNSCAAKVVAVYDCYEKELCGKGDKVWALDDLRVLADRHSKCAAERSAGGACIGNGNKNGKAP